MTVMFQHQTEHFVRLDADDRYIFDPNDGERYPFTVEMVGFVHGSTRARLSGHETTPPTRYVSHHVYVEDLTAEDYPEGGERTAELMAECEADWRANLDASL